MKKIKNKFNYKKVFAQIFLFLFLLNTVIYVPYSINYTYAQGDHDFTTVDTGLYNLGGDVNTQNTSVPGDVDYADFGRDALYGGSDVRNTQIDNTPSGASGMPGAQTMNLLYPVGPPNEVSFENVSADFISCVGAMMAVNLMQGPIRVIQKIGSTIGEALFSAPNASGTWHIGLASIATSPVSEQRVQIDEASISEHGVTILGVPIFISTQDMAFCAKNVLYSYLTGTVIKWVNEGFNDAAVWVEDIASTLNNVYAISYMEAIGEINLCVEIEAAVKVAVDLDFLKTQPVPPRTGCTITIEERVEVDAMLSGEGFSIDAFEKIYSNPSNNAMGGFLMTTSLANKKAATNEKNLLLELNWGNGWWPFKDEQGKTITPGQVVQNKVADILRIETQHHMLADGWNQVIFLITNQLLRKEIGNVQSPMSM